MQAPSILKKTTIKTKQSLMYYIGAFNFMYVYTILAYSFAVFIVERFPDNPNAIFFVGVILALSNFTGLFINGVWLYLQKTVKPKNLILISVAGIIVSVSIFLGSQLFFPILALPAFTLLAAFCYIWSFDLYDITMTTLILNKTKPENQSAQFSQKKISESIGMLFGIITGGALLYFGSIVSQFFLLVFLFGLFLYFKLKFNNEEDENILLSFSEDSKTQWKDVLKNLHHTDKVKEKIVNASENIQKKVIHISKAVSNTIYKEVKNIPSTSSESLKEVSKKTKNILNEARLLLLDILAKENELQRKNVKKHDFHMKEILSEITKSFTLLSRSFSFSTRYAFFLASIMVMFFSFWDTMAITYQPIFLKQFEGTLGIFSVMIMPIFILPVFVLQIPFGKLSDKWGSHVMILIGLFVSGLSLVLLGTLDVLWGGSITMLIISGMGNSIGYAAAFSASQVKLTQELSYYVKVTKQKIENSALAATLRLALNIGNIFGQLFGGLIFSLLGFYSGFFMIGICLFLLFFISLIFVRHLAIPDLSTK